MLNKIVREEIRKHRYLQVPAMILCYRKMTDPENAGILGITEATV